VGRRIIKMALTPDKQLTLFLAPAALTTAKGAAVKNR
jgi:hypothetical protein